jgi:hypothetical protein
MYGHSRVVGKGECPREPVVEVIETSELGDRSCVAHDRDVAVVVDRQRDLDQVEQVLADRGVRCVLVVETHIHNDYVTGGLEPARRTGAGYLIAAAADEVEFDRDPVSDGDERAAGTLQVRIVATAGHTDHHLSPTSWRPATGHQRCSPAAPPGRPRAGTPARSESNEAATTPSSSPTRTPSSSV